MRSASLEKGVESPRHTPTAHRQRPTDPQTHRPTESRHTDRGRQVLSKVPVMIVSASKHLPLYTIWGINVRSTTLPHPPGHPHTCTREEGERGRGDCYEECIDRYLRTDRLRSHHRCTDRPQSHRDRPKRVCERPKPPTLTCPPRRTSGGALRLSRSHDNALCPDVCRSRARRTVLTRCLFERCSC